MRFSMVLEIVSTRRLWSCPKDNSLLWTLTCVLGVGAHLCILAWHFQFIFLKIRACIGKFTLQTACLWKWRWLRHTAELLYNSLTNSMPSPWVGLCRYWFIKQDLKISVMVFPLGEAAQNLQSFVLGTKVILGCPCFCRRTYGLHLPMKIHS